MDLLIQSKAIKIYFFTAIILKKKIYLIKTKIVLILFTNVNECIVIGL